MALHVASGSTAPLTARTHVTLRVCWPMDEHGAEGAEVDVLPGLQEVHGPTAHTATSLGHGKRLQGRVADGGGCMRQGEGREKGRKGGGNWVGVGWASKPQLTTRHGKDGRVATSLLTETHSLQLTNSAIAHSRLNTRTHRQDLAVV